MQEIVDMDDALGHWISGFVDGEGCFSYQKRGYANPSFSLSMRDDDEDVVMEIVEALGNIGSVHHRPNDGNTSNPAIFWLVSGKSDCQKLIDHFDKYPLRSKKARDYEIWKELVREYAKPSAVRSREKMIVLCDALSDVKKYRSYDNIQFPVFDEQIKLILWPSQDHAGSWVK